MRFSAVVPSMEEEAEKARSEGKTESSIRTVINVREQREREAQAAYDASRGSPAK